MRLTADVRTDDRTQADSTFCSLVRSINAADVSPHAADVPTSRILSRDNPEPRYTLSPARPAVTNPAGRY